MTAAVSDNIVRQSEYIANRTIKIVKIKDENRSDIALTTGTSWYITDLVKYMLIGSSNKAAETLASQMIPRSSFISLMNFEARQLGLTNTRFYNPSGLTTTSTVLGKKVTNPGAVSTAKELATMMWKIIEQHSGLLEITQVQGGAFSNGVNSFGIQNTNKLIKDLPIVVGKTGFTELSGGNLAVVLQKSPRSHAYVIVVLGSTEEDRFKDVAALSEVVLKIDAAKYPLNN
jgi:D-alanyl-D-alanine carboxypeptidase